ncbi:MAG: phosphoenolpyruvate-utilizing N-terminal domain-containing protein, partial [Myxococcota bacterium]
LVGLTAQRGVPVVSSEAPAHERFRVFEELDESDLSYFAAAPVAGAQGALGVVAVQRSRAPFSEMEVCLLTALTAPIGSAVRLARLLDDIKKGAAKKRRGRRKVTLTGVPVVSGQAMGALAPVERPQLDPEATPAPDAAERLDHAFDLASRALGDLVRRSREVELSRQELGFLQQYRLMLDDQRLRRHAKSAVDEGFSPRAALDQVVRSASRAAAQRDDAFLLERARDLEFLCDAIAVLADTRGQPTLPTGAIVVAEHLSIYDWIVTTRAQPTGFVLVGADESRPADARTGLFLELLDVATVREVEGVFRWCSPGDVALLDADHGLLIVNPTRSEIAAFRAQRRATIRQSRMGRDAAAESWT